VSEQGVDRAPGPPRTSTTVCSSSGCGGPLPGAVRPNSDGLVGSAGLEPAASCVTGTRSNQLTYAPAWDTLIIVPSDIARFPLVSFPAVPSDRAVTGQQ
jgi:hypothetical protein